MLFIVWHNIYQSFPTIQDDQGQEDFCWAFVHMEKLLPLAMMVAIFGISEYQIHRILKLFKETSKPYIRPAEKLVNTIS